MRAIDKSTGIKVPKIFSLPLGICVLLRCDSGVIIRPARQKIGEVNLRTGPILFYSSVTPLQNDNIDNMDMRQGQMHHFLHLVCVHLIRITIQHIKI